MSQLAAAVVAALLVAAPARGFAAGDPRAGERLYLGETRLANGGAPCLACHGLAGHGLAWNASFGPDLSAVAASYDAPTLEGILTDVPFPSMAPIYRAHAITPSEAADLAAFLVGSSAPGVALADARSSLLLEAGAGIAAVIAIVLLLARRRMPPVRRALLAARAAQGGAR